MSINLARVLRSYRIWGMYERMDADIQVILSMMWSYSPQAKRDMETASLDWAS